MKKKIIAVIAAGVMVLGCFTTVSAKDPWDKAWETLFNDDLSSTGVAVWGNERIDDYQGSSDDWSIDHYEVDTSGQEFTIFNEEAALAHLIAQYPKYKVIRLFNITADDADDDDPQEVTISDLAIKGNKKYVLMELDSSTGEWYAGGTIVSIKDGLIKAKVTGSDSYAICEVKGSGTTATTATAAATTATAGTTTGTGKTAAKMGEV